MNSPKNILHIPDFIIKLHIVIPFLIRVISLMKGKMEPGLARAMERTTNFEYNILIICRSVSVSVWLRYSYPLGFDVTGESAGLVALS